MTEQLSSPASNRLLIIGSGLAANRLLEELDLQHPFSEILLLDDEGVAHYNRIMLSPLLAGEGSLHTTITGIGPGAFGACHLGRSVASIRNSNAFMPKMATHCATTNW